jgi:hypothetical protein
MKGERKRDPSGKGGPVTFETVREIARELPGVVEGTAYGTPAYRAGKTLFAREHDSGECLVVRIEYDQRSMRMRADPETFYITDHYLNYPWMLVRLATVDREDLADLLEDAWRLSATKRLISARDGEQKDKGAKRSPSRKLRDAE